MPWAIIYSAGNPEETLERQEKQSPPRYEMIALELEMTQRGKQKSEKFFVNLPNEKKKKKAPPKFTSNLGLADCNWDGEAFCTAAEWAAQIRLQVPMQALSLGRVKQLLACPHCTFNLS